MKLGQLRFVSEIHANGQSPWEVVRARLGRREVIVKVGLINKVWSTPYHEAAILAQLPEDSYFFPAVFGQGECTITDFAQFVGGSAAHLIKVFSIGENKVDCELTYTLDHPRPSLRGYTNLEPARICCQADTTLAFIVEEFVVGRPLSECVKSPRLEEYVRLVIRAISLMGATGVVHNDLHWDNILVRNHCPVIIDYDRATSVQHPAVLPGYLPSHGQDATPTLGRDLLLFVYYLRINVEDQKLFKRIAHAALPSAAPLECPWEEAIVIDKMLKARYEVLMTFERDSCLLDANYIAQLINLHHMVEHF